jgi:ferredoxin
MHRIVDHIRKTATDLLNSGTVEMVVGYARGTLPMSSRPFVARTPKEAAQLWWDDFCVMNLATFIPRKSNRRIAVLAKGCDSRSLIVHHREGQIDLTDTITVLGVPCDGMLDAERICRAAAGSGRIESVHVENQMVIVRGPDLEMTLPRQDLLREACCECRHSNPVIAHEWMGVPIPRDSGPSVNKHLAQLEVLAPEARIAFLRELFSPCIFCFACRQACPLCYCQTCFVDKAKPLWMSGSIWGTDALNFHFVRAFHLAGRCTDCGACESACPVQIPVRVLARKLAREIEKTHGYEAGMVLDALSPEVLFRPDLHEAQAEGQMPPPK